MRLRDFARGTAAGVCLTIALVNCVGDDVSYGPVSGVQGGSGEGAGDATVDGQAEDASAVAPSEASADAADATLLDAMTNDAGADAPVADASDGGSAALDATDDATDDANANDAASADAGDAADGA